MHAFLEIKSYEGSIS